MLLVPAGAVPAILIEAWHAGAHLGFRASCEAGAILLGDLLPDQVEAALDAIGVRPWLRAMTPPIRLTAEMDPSADGHVMMRLARPQTGRDLYWVVRTQGEAEPLDVEDAMTELLHSPVKAAEALVYDPVTRRDPPSVVIRVETHRAATMDRMVAAGLTVAVRGRRYRVEPVIAIGQRTHLIPAADTAADLLHRAAAAAGRGRAGLHAAVLEATPADRAGAPTDGDVVARVLGVGNAEWARGGTRREAVYTHPLTRALTGIVMEDCGDLDGPLDRETACRACDPATSLEPNDVDGEYGHWRRDLLPGDGIACAVAAGGRVTIRGAGEHGDVVITRAAWVRVLVPREAASRAAAAQASVELNVEIVGVVARVWMRRGTGDPPPAGSERSRAAIDRGGVAALPLPEIQDPPDLGRWVRAWIRREQEGATTAALGPVGPLQNAAATALQEFIGAAPAQLSTDLSEWLREHIQYGLEQAFMQWQ